MVDRSNLLDQLNKLPDSQWEEILFRFDVDEAHLPIGGTKNQRSIAFIRLLQQQEYGLQRLQKALRDLNFFKEFIPKGTYPVGDGLRQREEAREQEAMQTAIARGDDPEDYRITPDKFYSFQPGTEWLGVFRQWDAARSFRTELLETTIRNSQSHRNCPATAIIGHGGSGKSVALRRLALDLVEQDYKVWWVENPEQLVVFGLDDLDNFIHHEDKPQFLLIDEIQNLHSNDPIYANRLQDYLKRNRSLVLVVAGRSLPTPLRLGTRDRDRFTPNEAADRVAILDKIAEELPAWASTATQLKAESLREARLVRILVVLARRQDPIPKTLAELEAAFLQILVDDLRRIERESAGLARAIMDVAVFREVGILYVSRSMLIALAEHYQPDAGIPTLFHEFDQKSPRWEPVISLLSYDSTEDIFQFHHDELAEGLIQASQIELTKPYIDNAYRKLILDIAIQRVVTQENLVNDQVTAKVISWLLYLFVRKYPKVATSDIVLQYIHRLLDVGISHNAYLRLIVDDSLSLNLQHQLDLLFLVASIVPTNSFVWGPVWKKLENVVPKEQQVSILNQIYEAGCRSEAILCPLLQSLPLEEAKFYATTWIQESQNSQILCSCLNLLGEEAKEEAHRLLQTNQIQNVLCTCLNLLGKEAKLEAHQLLQKSRNHAVLCRCLELLGAEAKPEARRLLQESQDKDVLCRCLELLGEEAKPEARRLLQESQDKDVLCRCLELLGAEAKPEARQLLQESQNPSVLCRCLELLGAEAKPEARRLLQESQDKDVLCRCLELLGEEAKPEARRLLQESQDKDVLCRCLELLREEAKPKAHHLLKKSQDHEVLCRCLDILGEEAKEESRQLLQKSQNEQVLGRCLKLLGEEGRSFAQQKIACWTETSSMLLIQCFTVAGDTPEAQEAANQILSRWKAGEKFDSRYKIVALRAPFDTDLRKERALAVLRNWYREYRPVVTAALTAFWNESNTVTYYCRKILKQWQKEIEYQHKNKHKHRNRNDGHIIKALSHPELKEEARKAAVQMLRVEDLSPGFLTELLLQRAVEITQGQFPSWIDGAEETEQLPSEQLAIMRPANILKSSRQAAKKSSVSRANHAGDSQSSQTQVAQQPESRNLDLWQQKLKDFDLDERKLIK
jgi:hypothetical protein